MSNRMAAIGNTIPEQTKHTPLFIIQPNLCQCNAYTITCLLQIAFRCFGVILIILCLEVLSNKQKCIFSKKIFFLLIINQIAVLHADSCFVKNFFICRQFKWFEGIMPLLNTELYQLGLMPSNYWKTSEYYIFISMT